MDDVEAIDRKPNDLDAAHIARAWCGDRPISIDRFPMGLVNYVYDVVLPHHAVVIRVAPSRETGWFAGAIHWSAVLRPLGVPLPAILDTGQHEGFEFLILERLPGTDLGAVYPTLSHEQKAGIASHVQQARTTLGRLPLGKGYGSAATVDGPFPHASWADVLKALLDQARPFLSPRLVDRSLIDAVAERLANSKGYFDQVEPRPFLDDATTKNVIVDQGSLTGIVDVDDICFGDPLLGVALTRVALLAESFTPDYVDLWCEQLRLSSKQLEALRLYVALYCLVLMSEMEQSFNREAAPPLDHERLNRLDVALRASLRPSDAI